MGEIGIPDVEHYPLAVLARAEEAEAERDAALSALRERDALINKMLAIHAAAYDPTVTAESYPGAAHEEAEEAWIREARALLAASQIEVPKPGRK